MNNPDAQGYLMIYPESHRHHRQIERIIREWMRVRRYDNSRLTLVRAPNNSLSLIQMWVVPAGAEKPEPKLMEAKMSISTILARHNSRYTMKHLLGLSLYGERRR